MADRKRQVAEDVPGDFFVDTTCIDCGTCREVAPEIFGDSPASAHVARQPVAAGEVRKAFQALLACPTGSIGSAHGRDAAPVVLDFPLPVEGEVYFCGFNSEKSYGGSSYFVRHPEGNWLIDSPRYVQRLADRLGEMGGVRYVFLTHRDDVADAHRYAERFGSERIIHEADQDSTLGAELVIRGRQAVTVGSDFMVIPVPGHTAGSCVLLHNGRYLFSGDHLSWDRWREELRASRRACWYSWTEQTESMRRLAGYSFEWVLPGHGYRVHLPPPLMREQLLGLAARMPGIRA